MAPLPAVLGALSVVPGLAQTGYGLYQAFKGSKELREAEANRPVYQAPEAATQALAQSQALASQGLPQASLQLAQDQIARSQAAAVRQQAAAGAAGMIRGVGATQMRTNDAYRNIMAADAQQRLANQQQYINQLGQYADYQDTEFQQNELYPWQEDYLQAQALQGAGLQNIGGGLQGTSQSALNLLGTGLFDDQLMGQGGGMMDSIQEKIAAWRERQRIKRGEKNNFGVRPTDNPFQTGSTSTPLGGGLYAEPAAGAPVAPALPRYDLLNPTPPNR